MSDKLQSFETCRYMRVLWLGFKSCYTGHPRFTDAALREQNDASILRLFETFLESAPQLVLQLYIMLVRPDHINWIQGNGRMMSRTLCVMQK